MTMKPYSTLKTLTTIKAYDPQIILTSQLPNKTITTIKTAFVRH